MSRRTCAYGSLDIGDLAVLTPEEVDYINKSEKPDFQTEKNIKTPALPDEKEFGWNDMFRAIVEEVKREIYEEMKSDLKKMGFKNKSHSNE